MRVVATEGSTISVIGLDAIDGSPILDIKPYRPIFDEPPAEPGEGEGGEPAVDRRERLGRRGQAGPMR